MRSALFKDGLRTGGGFAVLFVLIAATALLMTGGGAWFIVGYVILMGLYCGGVMLVAMSYDRRPGVPIPRGAVLVASAMFVPMLIWPVPGAAWYLALAGDRVETTVVSATSEYAPGEGYGPLRVTAAGVGPVQPICADVLRAGEPITVWTDPGGWAEPVSAACTGYALTSGASAVVYLALAGGAVALRLSTLAAGDAPQGPLRLGSTIGPLARYARRRS